MNLTAQEILKIGDALSLFISFSGIIVIVFGIFVAMLKSVKNALYGVSFNQNYKFLRRNIGRAILLGLEFLIAGDIIRSVTGTPSLNAVAILGLIVLIRSFLGITFEMEVDGHWPWQKRKYKS